MLPSGLVVNWKAKTQQGVFSPADRRSAASKEPESEPLGGLNDDDAAAVQPKRAWMNARNRKDNVFHHYAAAAVFLYQPHILTIFILDRCHR